MSTAAPALELDNVSVSFRTGISMNRVVVQALRQVSISVNFGETLGLVGESGSGKTTTGLVALGLQRPTSGAMRFAGQPFPRNRRLITGQLQAVLQHPQWSLNPRMRVGRCIAEPLVIAGGSSKEQIAHETAVLLDQVGLASVVSDRYPHELSGGQRQRVSIARALITQPKFIVFDEAVSALDVSVQAQILNLVKDLQAQRRFGALFISHDLGAVRYVADRISVMRHGEVVETADTSLFYSAPKHEYSRRLLEAL